MRVSSKELQRLEANGTNVKRVQPEQDKIIILLERLVEALKNQKDVNVNPRFNVEPPIINVSSPNVKVEPSVNVNVQRITQWTFRITERDSMGKIKELTAIAK